jgi:hypothetical protein
MNNAETGIKIIYESMIKGLLEFLEKGTFPNNSPNSYMTAYSEVHKLADDDNNSSEPLFNYYVKVITDYVTKAYNKIRTSTDEKLVNDFLDENSKCTQLIYWMKRIFIYLDKFYTKNKNKGSLVTNGLQIYKDKMFIPLKEKLYEQVNKMIKEDRNNSVIYRFEIKNILRIIEEVDMNKPDIVKENEKLSWSGEHKNQFITDWFDNYFKKSTQDFIKMKAQNDIRSKSAPEYIKSSLEYLDKEKERENEYINKTFWQQIDIINNKALIEDNAKRLQEMDTGIPFMLKNKKDEEIKEAYTLISRFPDSLKVISEVFDPYIRERGDELYKDKELTKDPLKFIPELIKLKKEMDSLVQYAFENNILFQDTKNKAFSFFMNKEIYSKQLSNYTDYMMKKGIKALSESQIEDVLNDIINLFKCLNSKLVFQLEANKKMSDRLIQNKSLSLIAEKNFITKLKTEAGVTYVNKMTEMMRDLDTSKTESDLYRQQKHRGQPYGIKFTAQVVSQSAWEISKNKMDKIEIPQILENCMKDFSDFYIGRHRNHKLLWCYGLGNVEIQYLSFQRKYVSTSTLCQYAILCNLEKYGKLTLEKIANLLGYNINAVLYDVSGLVYNPSFNRNRAKDKGLIKGTFGDDFKASDEIEFNNEFNNSTIKFNTMPLLQKKKGENKEQELEEKTIKRRYEENILQSTLTRIMKSRIGIKTTHVWLISECAKQIELFKAQPQQIKENIEKLIEKGIIKRNEKDRTCYEYIA